MTKFVTIFVVALLVVAIPSIAADKPPETDECLKSSGAVEADVFARPRKDTEPVKCFWKCVLTKRGVIGADGTFNPDLFGKGFPKASSAITEQQIADMKKCLATIGKISSCADMDKMRTCFQTIFKKN